MKVTLSLPEITKKNLKVKGVKDLTELSKEETREFWRKTNKEYWSQFDKLTA